MKGKRYDHKLAPKLWRYVADEAAKSYAKEHAGGVQDAKRIFPGKVRDEVAKVLADEYAERIGSKEFGGFSESWKPSDRKSSLTSRDIKDHGINPDQLETVYDAATTKGWSVAIFKKGRTYFVFQKYKTDSGSEMQKITDKNKVQKMMDTWNKSATSNLRSESIKFNKKMLDQLRDEYGKVNTVNPSSSSYKKLVSLLDSLDKKALLQLSKAKIKFVSPLAKNRVQKESVQLTEEDASSWYVGVLYRVDVNKSATVNKFKKSLVKWMKDYRGSFEHSVKEGNSEYAIWKFPQNRSAKKFWGAVINNSHSLGMAEKSVGIQLTQDKSKIKRNAMRVQKESVQIKEASMSSDHHVVVEIKQPHLSTSVKDGGTVVFVGSKSKATSEIKKLRKKNPSYQYIMVYTMEKIKVGTKYIRGAFKESVQLKEGLTIGKQDKAVIIAFADEQPAKGKKLSTDGKRLDGDWMGGKGIAEWKGRKVHLNDLGSKAAQTVQKMVKRFVPKVITVESEEYYHLPLMTEKKEMSAKEHYKKYKRELKAKTRGTRINPDEYPPIKGMEGPFGFKTGFILYYDRREGKYYDRKRDMYLSTREMEVQTGLVPSWRDEMKAKKNKLGSRIKKEGVSGPTRMQIQKQLDMLMKARPNLRTALNDLEMQFDIYDVKTSGSMKRPKIVSYKVNK